MNRAWMLGLAGTTAALAAGAGPAAAQCRLCSSPSTLPAQEDSAQRITLEIEATLDFDRLLLTGAGGATARLGPDGSRMVSGDVAGLSGRAMVGSAVIRGEPDRLVRIGLPGRIELYGTTGGRIRIERLATDVPPVARLDSAGRLGFQFGGELRIDGDVDGDFRGEVPITVEYL